MTSARKPHKGRLDVEVVRQAATGRWLEILQSVGGIDLSILDGQHHPCPKCPDHGADRFRLIDDTVGAVLCNQCFSSKNGDGFTAVGWMLGVKFGEALKQVAAYLGVEAAAGDVDPAKDLRFVEWSSALAGWFLRAKPPITEKALFDFGARMARYKEKYTVIAIPIIGENLDCTKPVGWCLYNYNGSKLPRWSPEGAIVDWTKVKITWGSSKGLVGVHGIERLKTVGLVELVWKGEGLTDALAIQSAIPEQLRDRHVVVTNANGSNEIPRWQPGILGHHNCNVIHDADKPGQEGSTKQAVGAGGAQRWAMMIAAQSVGEVVTRNVQLPYTIEATHGKDSRDYLSEGHSYGDLLTLADQAEATAVARTETGEVDLTQATYPIQEKILKQLQLEILYEDDNCGLRVFSQFHRKSTTIRKVDQLRKSTLLQICGPPAQEHIGEESDGESTWAVEDVRNALGLLGGACRAKGDERGVGVWQGLDGNGNHAESIVLANCTSAAVWTGDGQLRQCSSPRTEGLLLDFGSPHQDWFDFEALARNVSAAGDVGWVNTVLDEAESLFIRWRWKHGEETPALVTGLVLATWVQTIWDWRPLVGIIGESNCGKSYLFESLGGGPQVLRGIFGDLAFKQAKSTEAGIRQGLGRTGRIVLVDEFEESKERPAVFKLLRAGTRGDVVARGTSSQQGKTYRICHLSWFASIESGLHEQADLNRFIILELLRAAPGQQGRLKLPTSQELQVLGQKLLAIAVRSAIPAKALARELKSTRIEGVEARAIENYAVPAAMLAAAVSLDGDAARQLLSRLTACVERAEQAVNDQDELLRAILAARVNCGAAGWLSVAQLLESRNHIQILEAVGVKLCVTPHEDGLFIASRIVARELLKGTRWEGHRLNEVLRRLKGAAEQNRRIAGSQQRGVLIPWATLAEFTRNDPLT